jgi:hypothetical protein
MVYGSGDSASHETLIPPEKLVCGTNPERRLFLKRCNNVKTDTMRELAIIEIVKSNMAHAKRERAMGLRAT